MILYIYIYACVCTASAISGVCKVGLLFVAERIYLLGLHEKYFFFFINVVIIHDFAMDDHGWMNTNHYMDTLILLFIPVKLPFSSSSFSLFVCSLAA